MRRKPAQETSLATSFAQPAGCTTGKQAVDIETVASSTSSAPGAVLIFFGRPASLPACPPARPPGCRFVAPLDGTEPLSLVL